MNIREINENEVASLYECITELSKYHNEVSVNFKGSYPTHNYQDTIEQFRQQLGSGYSKIAVIGDEAIQGFCKVDIDKRNGKLDYLMVLEKYRGKGYGRILMDWAIQCFKSNQVCSVEVKVVDGNPALHLYEKYGFFMNAHILRRDF